MAFDSLHPARKRKHILLVQLHKSPAYGSVGISRKVHKPFDVSGGSRNGVRKHAKRQAFGQVYSRKSSDRRAGNNRNKPDANILFCAISDTLGNAYVYMHLLPVRARFPPAASAFAVLERRGNARSRMRANRV